MKLTDRRFLFAAIAAIPLFASIGGAAYAFISDSGVISACSQKQSGVLRVLDAGASCNPSENPISWNQQGPIGSGFTTVQPVSIGVGGSVTLFTSGVFTVAATCGTGPNTGEVLSTLLISTSEAGSAYGNAYPELPSLITDAHQDADFGPGDGQEILAQRQVGGGATIFEPVPFSAVGATGLQLGGQLWMRPKTFGTPMCTFGGYFLES